MHYFTVDDSKLTKTGFIVVADSNLYLVSMKMGFFGGAQTEAIPYNNIKSIDFDLAPDPVGIALTNLGILYLEINGIIGSSKRTIRNIPEEHLDNLRKAIQAKL
ncbi:PH domain-containing protein [Fictibacillus sp. KIGAM418]|uniref:PH domain-containing protein n=1 Tax=Fictibacillus marinisediminis TaxID=2878389 RepID=A0A9X1XFN2_9BACL|nr:PH domain-containing protein [Fictibacillus marinisediminis]